MPEKRRFARFKTTLYVLYNLLNDSREFSGIAKDISMGGMKLALDKSINISVDDFIALHLLIPQITIRVLGKIIWVNESGQDKDAGVSFVNLSDAHKEDIYNFIFKYYREEITNRWWDNS